VGTSQYSQRQVYDNYWNHTDSKCLLRGVASILRVREPSRGGACIFWSRRGERSGETSRGIHFGAIIKSSLRG